MTRRDPPKLVLKFFQWFCRDDHLEGLEGDLYEQYDRHIEEYGRKLAWLMYSLDVLSLLRPSVSRNFFKNSKSNHMGFFGNYFKTAVRLGWKRKTFSAINLIGLTLGISSVMFITLYVHDEMRYDEHISKGSSKYRIYNQVHKNDGIVNFLPIVPPMYATGIAETFPQVEKIGRIYNDYGGTVFNAGDKVFSEKNGVFAELNALEILDLKMTKGNVNDLSAPRKMLLSESMFKKFFGEEDFLNQTVKLTRSTVEIVGIYQDFPERSHLKPDYIFSFDWLLEFIPDHRMKVWTWQQFYTYVQLKPEVDLITFQASLEEFIEEKTGEATAEYGFSFTPRLQNIRDIHLHSSNFQWDIADVGNYQSILFLSFAASIILLIACLNFVNLTTAQAIRRAKEVSIRKFVGAHRTHLLVQYSFESVLYCFTAGTLSIVLLISGLEFFNNFSDKSFTLSEVFGPQYLMIFVTGLILLGIISAWYPALLITRHQPIATLRGSDHFEISKKYGLKMDSKQFLVGAQYVLSIALIIISLIIQRQYNFLQQTDMGFDKENLLYIPLTNSLSKDLIATREAFSSHSNIENITFCYGIPGGIIAGDGITLPRIQDNETSLSMFIVDANYLKTMEMEIVAGRGFSTDMASDVSEAFILNETAVANFGLGTPEEAIGEPVTWKMWTSNDSMKRGRVIGVVADFNYKSLHHQIESAVLHISPHNFEYMLIRFGQGNLIDAMSFVESQYKSFEPNRPFNYEFVDRSFDKFYSREAKTSDLFAFFTLLAILTAAIGLYGLVSYNVMSKSREISIRKVLGAEASTIFYMLVKRYFVMVTISLFIAIPIAYYVAEEWLVNFAYRIGIDIFIFIEVTGITLILTLITVGFQAIRGALSNPADNLRTE